MSEEGSILSLLLRMDAKLDKMDERLLSLEMTRAGHRVMMKIVMLGFAAAGSALTALISNMFGGK